MVRISAGAAVAPSPQLLRTVYGLLLLGAFLWCAAVLCAPLLLGLGDGLEKPARVLYDFFGRVCHQRDDHCLHLGGAKLAVCHVFPNVQAQAVSRLESGKWGWLFVVDQYGGGDDEPQVRLAVYHSPGTVGSGGAPVRRAPAPPPAPVP